VRAGRVGRLADKNVGDTADWKVCATSVAGWPRCTVSPIGNRQTVATAEILRMSEGCRLKTLKTCDLPTEKVKFVDAAGEHLRAFALIPAAEIGFKISGALASLSA
jgi:hypothetical protein